MKLNSTNFNSDWNNKTLSELGTFARGKSRHRPRNDPALYTGGCHPLIQTGDVTQATFRITSHSATYNNMGLAQSKLWPEGTLCITIAANIAETALLGYPMCFPDSVVGFSANPDETSEVFMHYVFTYIRKAIQNSVTGSIQDNINIEYLTNLRFKIPSPDEQGKIASVLSTLDAKIDLNNRINAELEALAKTIYDYWFVQFDFPDANGRPYKSSGGAMVWNDTLKREIPAGWKTCCLGEVISRSGTGLNPRDNFELGRGSNYYVTIKNVSNGRIVLDDKCDRVDDEALEIIDRRSQLKSGDVLFTSIEPVGVTYLIHEKPENWNINESVFTIRPDRRVITSEYLLLLLSSQQMKSFTKNSSTGSIHKGIRHAVLKSFNLAYGNKNLIDRFSLAAAPILMEMRVLDLESQELTQLRDWLLPLLMNGQVRVAGDAS